MYDYYYYYYYYYYLTFPPTGLSGNLGGMERGGKGKGKGKGGGDHLPYFPPTGFCLKYHLVIRHRDSTERLRVRHLGQRRNNVGQTDHVHVVNPVKRTQGHWLLPNWQRSLFRPRSSCTMTHISADVQRITLVRHWLYE